MPDYRRTGGAKVLVSGLPGSGKTTLCRRVVDSSGVDWAGFYTEEIRVGRGNREGFRLVMLTGASEVLAHRDGPWKARVGRYRVNLEAVTRFGVRALRERDAHQPVLIDEIGKMETLSDRFRREMDSLLKERELVLLATVPLRGNRYIQELKSRKGLTLVELTLSNRDTLADQVLQLLGFR